MLKGGNAMHSDFLCPHCRSHLRVGDYVVFRIKKKKWEGAIILMHPEVGNYHVEHHPSFIFEEGEKFDFHCPVCQHDLASSKHDDLAMVLMRDNTGETYQIYFSTIAGEKSTLKMMGEHVELYGKDSEKYVDFFTLSQLH
ncbi:MAG: hypothetical protein R6T99_02255 [Bacteroidales bacterium]